MPKSSTETSDGLRASARKLVDLAARKGATIVHGHDAEQSRELRKSPTFEE